MSTKWTTEIDEGDVILLRTANFALKIGNADLSHLLAAEHNSDVGLISQASNWIRTTMKKLLPIIIAVSIGTSALCTIGGCANFGHQIQQIESAEQLRADLAYVGARAKQYVSPENKAKIHQFAVTLQTTADLNLSALFALLPQTTGNVYLDMGLATAKTVLQLAVIKWGSNNGTTLAYAHAAADGLLQNF